MVDEIADRSRLQEDDYFHRKDRELLEQLRKDAQRQAERQRTARAAGLAEDHAVLDDLEKLGWTAEMLKLIHLFPLIQVAWADGRVDAKERELILEAAAVHGVSAGPAHERLSAALSERPNDDEFARATAILAALMSALPADQQAESKRNLVSYASAIAAAAGGSFGFGSKVSAQEAAALQRIAAALETSHSAAAAEVVKKA